MFLSFVEKRNWIIQDFGRGIQPKHFIQNESLKTKEKNKLDTLLQDMEKDLKNKRVEKAILDKELSKVNKDMKKVLEYSIYEQEPTTAEDEWLWNIPENKMRSYMDLADMKTRSKVLFDEIIQYHPY